MTTPRRVSLILALALALVLCLSSVAVTEEEALFRVKVGDLWGFINSRGETVLEPQWKAAGNFRNGYAIASIGESKDGIINTKGEWVVEPVYVVDEGYDGEYFGGKDTGVIWAADNEGRSGYFDVANGYFSGMQYGALINPWYVSEKMVGVCNDESLYGYVRRDTGELVIPYQYEDCETFEYGYACIGSDDDSETFFLIDETGAPIALPEGYAAYMSGFSEGLLAVQNVETGLIGFVDVDCKLVIPAIYEEVTRFKDGYASVRLNELWGHIDASGKVICEPKFECNFGYMFSNGYALVNFEDTTVIDVEGNELFEAKDIMLDDFNEYGTAMFSNPDGSEGIGLIDATGKVLIPLDAGYDFEHTYMFGYEDYFAEGLQVLTKDGLFGFIDPQGNTVIDFQYDYAENFSNGLTRVTTIEGKMTYINHDGSIVWQEP